MGRGGVVGFSNKYLSRAFGLETRPFISINFLKDLKLHIVIRQVISRTPIGLGQRTIFFLRRHKGLQLGFCFALLL